MKSTSESFFTAGTITLSEQFGELTPLPSRGYSLLVKAKRYGRWWLLKGLKEEYRDQAVYNAFLQKEYDILRQMQHPMIVSVFSFEHVEGLGWCIVMEWIEGETLKQWLLSPHSLSQRKHIATLLLEAVSYVHSLQTEHRDLKPSNVMVTNGGQYLKLIDFGLSDTQNYAILKAPGGTEGYMAPDGPSDVYSLGCIFRELRLGWFPRCVVRKCCAAKQNRYTDIAAIRRDLLRCWTWPRRVAVSIISVMTVATAFLFYHSHTQEQLQAVSDSLKTASQEYKEKFASSQAKADSMQIQVEQVASQQQAEQTAIQRHKDHIEAKKRRIDRKVKTLGIEQMLDTVSCRRNISIPLLRIVDELIKDTEEPELRDYIETRYRKPWLRRMNELPFD